MSTPDGPSAARRQPEVWIRRVRIRNYRSIAHCDVELRPLTVLVGRNGSGKSNFVDAIAFIKNILWETFGRAIASRGGARSVFFLGLDEPRSLLIELTLEFAEGSIGVYGLELREPLPLLRERHRVREWLRLERRGMTSLAIRVEGDELVEWTDNEANSPYDPGAARSRFTRDNAPPVIPDHSYLLSAAVAPDVGKIALALHGAEFYDFAPREMRSTWPGGVEEQKLDSDGSNIAGAVAWLEDQQPETLRERVTAYLRFITPGVQAVQAQLHESFTSLSIRQVIGGREQNVSSFMMSDGTLRALGSLVAVAQPSTEGLPVRVVAIEEPETSIHPAAVRALVDAFDEATVERQVIITTHSPDVLDRLDLDKHQLLAVEAGEDGTRITPIDQASREAIKERLSTAGQLLQTDYIETDWRDLERQRASFQGVSGVDAPR